MTCWLTPRCVSGFLFKGRSDTRRHPTFFAGRPNESVQPRAAPDNVDPLPYCGDAELVWGETVRIDLISRFLQPPLHLSPGRSTVMAGKVGDVLEDEVFGVVSFKNRRDILEQRSPARTP